MIGQITGRITRQLIVFGWLTRLINLTGNWTHKTRGITGWGWVTRWEMDNGLVMFVVVYFQ